MLHMRKKMSSRRQGGRLTHAAAVTIGSFYGSRSSGIGQEVNVSIMECLSSTPEGTGRLMAYACTEDDLKRAGHKKEGIYPYGYYPCIVWENIMNMTSTFFVLQDIPLSPYG